MQALFAHLLRIGAITAIGGASMSAQQVDVLYSFSKESASIARTNTDGAGPSGLSLSGGGTLFGTATYGGRNGAGSVFRIRPDGSGFTPIYAFSPISDLPPAINGEGARPGAGVILVGNSLYGTAYYGGNLGGGTVFGMDTNGQSFQLLHYFPAGNILSPTNHDGFWPLGGLVSSGTTLYGTTSTGGALGGGTVFSISRDGSGFQVVHNLDYGTGASSLVLSSNMLYGTTVFGGSSNQGTVFGVSTDGVSFVVLHPFKGAGDGSQPRGGLALSSNVLFGTTSSGGVSSNGTVFRVNVDGSGFSTLHNFSELEGVDPVGTLLVVGRTLYGTTASGGNSGNGTVFSMNIDGTAFTTIHSLSGGSDGAAPGGQLVSSGNVLYGTATAGGLAGSGTVFSLLFQPDLSIENVGNNIIFSWPTNYAGFDYSIYILQSNTNLVSSAWHAVSSAPLVINGQNTVTNPTPGDLQTFFRLSRSGLTR